MIITTEEEYYAALAAIQQEQIVVIDTETHMTDIWDGRALLGVAVFCPQRGEGYYFSVGHRQHMRAKNFPVEPVLETLSGVPEWIMHNRKFDDQVLRYAGLKKFPPVIYDTMLMAWLLDESPPHGLKELYMKHIDPTGDMERGELKKLMKDHKMVWEDIPSDVMGLYAIKDVKMPWALYQFYKPEFEGELGEVLLRELTFQKVLTDIEFVGVRFDRDLALQFGAQAQERMNQILAQLQFDPGKPSQLANKLFGQLKLVPISFSGSPSKSFPSGRPLMNKAALTSYRNAPEEAKEVLNLVLEYRTLEKAKSTWYYGWSDLGPGGTLHPSYSQHSDGIERKDEKFGTVTGRLTCSKPNMQQVPRAGAVKGLLRAVPGCDLVEFDYSQAEFRLAAVYAEDEDVLAQLRAGIDFHSVVAEMLSIDRQSAKTINFAILYGGREPTLSRNLGISFEEANAVLKAYDEMLPGFSKIKQQVEWAFREKGWIRMWSGRRRHLKESYKAKDGFNSLIQGGVSDIVKETMIKLSQSGLPLTLVGQVHDSLWIEVPSDRQDVLPLIRSLMEWPGQEFGVPFPVDMKILYKGNPYEIVRS
jgi:DNA polymerase I